MTLAHTSQTQVANPNQAEPNKMLPHSLHPTKLQSTILNNYAVINETLTEPLIEFVNKIFSSIARQDVQILNEWSEDVNFAPMQNVFKQVPSQELKPYLQTIGELKKNLKQEELCIVLNFQKDSGMKSEMTRAMIAESWICISTHSIQDILTQPSKKAEFWNFLKHLKF
jgi:hypothetical protein